MTALSSWFNAYRLLPVVLAFVCGALLATTQSFAGKSKDESVSATGRVGKTVFVDVSAFGRRSRAAKRMTKLHEEFAQEGWTVVDVAVYTEDGNLEGFFVTYVKE